MKSYSDEELEQRIGWLKSRVNRFATQSNIDYWFSMICKKFGGAIPEFERITTERDHFFFRARPSIQITEPQLKDTKTFSYPPSEFAGNGRANLKGFPVFYATDSIEEALLEINQFNDKACSYVALWKYSGQLNCLQFYYHKQGVGNRISELQEICYKSLDSQFGNYGPEERRRMAKLHEELSNIFLDEEHFLSSIIAHKKLYVHKSHSGIVFNGTHSLQTCNYAFHPDIADNMEFVKAFRVVRYCGKTIVERVGGMCDDGEIKWEEANNEAMTINEEINWSVDKNYIPGVRPNA